jgi:O-methyltransferase involved in polyketide biosynthesis
MDTEQHISDTAFLVNESRARKLDVSQDIYAEHWVRPESRERIRNLWDAFAREVYPHDDLELAVRNRYFFEHLVELVNISEKPVFVNLGAGFTSYPFLLNQAIPCIEVDYPHVIAYKQDRIKHLQEEGILPHRNLEFFPVDLCNADDREKLKVELAARISGNSSYILLEGVSYYLPMPALLAIIEFIRDIQSIGSIFAFDFWKPDLTRHPVFIQLQTFFADRFGFEARDYNLFDREFIESIASYQLLEISDATEQERIYAGTNVLADYSKILPENYAILTKRQRVT